MVIWARGGKWASAEHPRATGPRPNCGRNNFLLFLTCGSRKSKKTPNCDGTIVASRPFDRLAAAASRKMKRKTKVVSEFGRDPVARGSSAKAPSSPRAHKHSITLLYNQIQEHMQFKHATMVTMNIALLLSQQLSRQALLTLARRYVARACFPSPSWCGSPP